MHAPRDSARPGCRDPSSAGHGSRRPFGRYHRPPPRPGTGRGQLRGQRGHARPRPDRTGWPAPPAARPARPATGPGARRPRPVPPVTSTVPARRPLAAAARRGAPAPAAAPGSRRRGSRPGPRRTRPAPRTAGPPPARPSAGGRSISPPHRSGCSRPATRPRPHTIACTGLATASPVPGRHRPAGQHPQRRLHPGIAQRLHQRQRPGQARRHHRDSPASGASSSASSDSTPASLGRPGPGRSGPPAPPGPPPPRRPRGPPPGRRAPASARTHPPASSPPAGPAGTTTSHVPDSATAAGSGTGTQATRYRQPASSPGRSVAARRPGRRLRPVPLALERVRGQVHPLPAGQHRRPVHRDAAHVHPASEARNRAGPPSSRRSVPVTTAAPASRPSRSRRSRSAPDAGTPRRTPGARRPAPDGPVELHRGAQAVVPVPGARPPARPATARSSPRPSGPAPGPG